MAFIKKLNKTIKSTLLLLASEFDTNVNSQNKVKEIIHAILNANDFDEETAKDFLERIEMELETEKLAKEQERLEREQERLGREKEMQFELEKLKLMNAADSSSTISAISAQESGPRKVSLKDLVPTFPALLRVFQFLAPFLFFPKNLSQFPHENHLHLR